MAIGSVITGGLTGLSALSALRSSSAARRAANQQGKLIDAQIDQINRVNELYDTGAEDLRSGFEAFLQQFGDSGFFNPQQIDDMAALLANERELGRWGVRGDMEDVLSKVTPDVADSILRSAGLASAVAPGTTGMVGRPRVDVSARDGVYDTDIEGLVGGFLDRFGYETDREAERLIGEVSNASIRNGTELSTADIEARKAAGDLIADRRYGDITKAIEAAMGTLGQRQALDTGNQGMRMTELGGKLNMSEFDRALAAMSFDQNLAGLSAAQGLEGNATSRYWTNRQNALGELAGIEGLVPDDTLKSYTQAMGLQGALGDLRGRGLTEIATLATAPYKFQAGGSDDIARLGAAGGSIANNSFLVNSSLAGQGWNAVGQGLDKLFKNVSWDSIFPGSGSSSTPSWSWSFGSGAAAP